MPSLNIGNSVPDGMERKITLDKLPILAYFCQKKPTDGIAEPGGLKLGYAITST